MCTDFFLRLRKMMSRQTAGNVAVGQWRQRRRRGMVHRPRLAHLGPPRLDRFLRPAALHEGRRDTSPRPGWRRRPAWAGAIWSPGWPSVGAGFIRPGSPPKSSRRKSPRRKAGAKGFSCSSRPYLEEKHYQAIRAAIQAKRNRRNQAVTATRGNNPLHLLAADGTSARALRGLSQFSSDENGTVPL